MVTFLKPMGHEMVPCAGEDAVSDWIEIGGLREREEA